MKILSCNKFFHMNGGSETVFFQERKFLKEEEVDVIDFSMKDQRNKYSPYEKYFVENIDYKDCSIKNKILSSLSFIHSREAVSRVKELIEFTNPDIAHFHNIYHQLTPSIIKVCKSQGVKTLLTLHDTKLICPNYLSLCEGEVCDKCQGRHYYNVLKRNCQNSISSSCLLMLEGYYHKIKKTYENVDKFIAPSQFLADKIYSFCPEFGKADVLVNGVSLQDYEVSSHDENYILFLGRLSHEKGIKTLLQSVELLKEKYSVKVVGTGPLLAELESCYPTVDFTGYQTGIALKNLIANASCIVVPSEWYENCSMVVLEAMAYGKPVIGSRVGGIPEQIQHMETGLLFEMRNMYELGSCIEHLMSSPKERNRMGREARKRIEEKYSLDTHNKQLLEIYKKMLI